MFKYAFTILNNKKDSKAIVKDCMKKHNKALAWYKKKRDIQQQRELIRTACHNLLQQQIKTIIHNRKNQPTNYIITNTVQSVTKTCIYEPFKF